MNGGGALFAARRCPRHRFCSGSHLRVFLSLSKLPHLSSSQKLFTQNITSCRRAAATICPRPGLQRKRAAAALSQAGRAGPDQPIRAIRPAGRTRRPPTGCTRQTSDQAWTGHCAIVPWHRRPPSTNTGASFEIF